MPAPLLKNRSTTTSGTRASDPGLKPTVLRSLKTSDITPKLKVDLQYDGDTIVASEYIARFNPSIAHITGSYFLLKYRAFSRYAMVNKFADFLNDYEVAIKYAKQFETDIFSMLDTSVFNMPRKTSLLELINYVQTHAKLDEHYQDLRPSYESMLPDATFSEIMLWYYWQPAFHEILTEKTRPVLLSQRQHLWNDETPTLRFLLRHLTYQALNPGDDSYLKKIADAELKLTQNWFDNFQQQARRWSTAASIFGRRFLGQFVQDGVPLLKTYLQTTDKEFSEALGAERRSVFTGENLQILQDFLQDRKLTVCQGSQTFCRPGSHFIPVGEMLQHSGTRQANPDSLHPAYGNWQNFTDGAGFAILKIDGDVKVMHDMLSITYEGDAADMASKSKDVKSDFPDARIMKYGSSGDEYYYTFSDDCYMGKARAFCVLDLTLTFNEKQVPKIKIDLRTERSAIQQQQLACAANFSSFDMPYGKNWSTLEVNPFTGANKFSYQFLPPLIIEQQPSDACTLTPGKSQVTEQAAKIPSYYTFTRAQGYRFSLGTPSIIYNNQEYIAVGHSRFYRKDLIDKDPKKKASDWTPNYAKVLALIEQQPQLYQTSNYNYFMYFYTLDRHTNRVRRMSHSFLVTGYEPYYLQFACGIARLPGDRFVISYGEGDVRCKLLFLNIPDIEILLQPIERMTSSAEYHQFLLLQ